MPDMRRTPWLPHVITTLRVVQHVRRQGHPEQEATLAVIDPGRQRRCAAVRETLREVGVLPGLTVHGMDVGEPVLGGGLPQGRPEDPGHGCRGTRPAERPAECGRTPAAGPSQARTFTALATTSPRIMRERTDWRVMTLLAQGASGMTSVGLSAVELVNPR